MSWNKRVVWFEGLFLKPQHFQQQDRYLDRLVKQRTEGIRSYSWGLRKIKINISLLQVGKFGVSECSGIFQDGTPFVMGEDLELPPPIDLPVGTANTIIYVCVPLQQPLNAEVEVNDGIIRSNTRFISESTDIPDTINGSNLSANIKVSSLNLRYMTAKEDRSSYLSLGLVRIKEVTSEKKILIDDNYIPPCMAANENITLSGFIAEILSMLNHRADALAQRVGGSGQGVAEITDFLMLQMINRNEPALDHISKLPYLHPEYLYEKFVSLAGELSTFTSGTKRADNYDTYIHDDLETVFNKIMNHLRKSLSVVVEQLAMQIPLEKRKFGIYVGEITDKNLFSNSSFVLIVKSTIPEENIRRGIPPLIKIGSIERIRDLVNVQLPGVVVRPLPTAPRQLPYHSGGVYFELDTNSSAWNDLKRGHAIALHLSGEFPDLSLDLWAIRAR